MSRADNSHFVIAAARQSAAATHKHAVSTLRRMDKAGLPITFDAVAREAWPGLSRPGSATSGPREFTAVMSQGRPGAAAARAERKCVRRR